MSDRSNFSDSKDYIIVEYQSSNYRFSKHVIKQINQMNFQIIIIIFLWKGSCNIPDLLALHFALSIT